MSDLARFLRALAWLRWHSLVNGIRAGVRKGALETFSRVLEVLVPAGLGLLVLGLATVLGFLAVLAGSALAGTDDEHRLVAGVGLRFLLGGIMAAVVLSPLLQALVASDRPATRFLLLPVSRRTLHFGSVLAGALDPWIACIIPGLLVGLPVGLLRVGAHGAVFVATLGGAAFLVLLLALNSCGSLLVGILLRDRRRAEVARFAVALLLGVVGFVPLLMSTGTIEHRLAGRRATAVADPATAAAPLDRTLGLPAWTRLLPSELHGEALHAATTTGLAGAVLPVAGIGLVAGLSLALSGRLHRVVLGAPTATLSSRRGTPPRLRLARVPGLSPPAAAVALATVRLALRTVRGRMAVFGTPLVMVMIGSFLLRMPSLHVPGLASVSSGYTLSFGGGAFALMGIGVFTLNQFAVDGPGLTLQFLSPASERDLLLGKATGGVLLAALATTVAGILAVVLAPRFSLFLVPAAVLGVAASAALVAPFAALLSILFARKADPSRVGRDGNVHAAAGLVGFFVMALALLPTGLLLGVTGSLMASPVLALGVVIPWAAVCCGLGSVLLLPLEGLLRSRREALGLTALGR